MVQGAPIVHAWYCMLCVWWVWKRSCTSIGCCGILYRSQQERILVQR